MLDRAGATGADASGGFNQQSAGSRSAPQPATADMNAGSSKMFDDDIPF